MKPILSLLLATSMLLVALSPPVSALTECTDFLTFIYSGYAKLPADAFDYNTTVQVVRVISGRVDGFHFPGLDKGFFYASLSPDPRQNTTPGSVYYHYYPGLADYYYRVLNASSVPWYCNADQIEGGLKISSKQAEGAFYSVNGTRLSVSKLPVLAFSSGYADAFSLKGFDSMTSFYISGDNNASSIPAGTVVYDAGGGKFIASGLQQIKFQIPANKAPFCNNYAEFCLDAAGTHGPTCNGRNAVEYSCVKSICTENVTKCSGSCSEAKCIDATPAPAATATSQAVESAPSAEPTTAPAIATAAPASPAKQSNDWLLWLVALLVLTAVAAYLFMLKKPKGL